MNLNVETDRLIESYKKKLLGGECNLTPGERWELYESFGQSRLFALDEIRRESSLKASRLELDKNYLKSEFMNLSLADYALGWLAVLTAQKVAPLWVITKELEEDGVTETPEQYITIAKEALEGKRSFEDLREALAEIPIDAEILTTYDLTCVINAVFYALHYLIHSLRLLKNQVKDYDNSPITPHGDFASWGQKAYCVTDKNPPGLVAEYYGYLVDTKDYPENNGYNYIHGKLIPLEFDLEKRREFWFWWLSEAIPQAFELAEDSLKNRNS